MELRKDAARTKTMEGQFNNNNKYAKQATRKGQVRDFIQGAAETKRTVVPILNEPAKRETLATIGVEPHDLDYREALRRHYLRTQDPELRQLVTKLQAVYVCRLQQHQILNNQYRKLQNKVEDAQSIRIQESAILAEQQEALSLEQEKSSRRTKYSQELQQQIENRQRDQLKQHQEALAENTGVTDSMNIISEQYMRELEQKRELKAKVHGEMMTSQRARAVREKQQQLTCVAEAKKIEQQIQEMADRDLDIKAEKKRKMQEKEKLNEKQAAKLLKDERERYERAEVIRQLIEREYIERSLNHDMLEREREERDKGEKLQEMSQHVEYKRRLVEEERNRKIRHLKVPSNEENNRPIESVKRDSQRRYGDDLLRQIEDNRRRREREIEDGAV